MLSARQIVNDFIRRGHIQPKQINDALHCTKVTPSINSWFKFIDQFLLCLGALSLGFSVLFFIAYNWSDWGRLEKFIFIESLLALTILVYWRSKKDSFKAQISLLVGCLMVGVLMAFFGQTYQTGADPWTLFFFWALLITPWVVIARFAPLWLSWLGLLNVALSLYIYGVGLPFSFLSSQAYNLQIAIFLLNSIALILLELCNQRFSYLSPRWLARTLALIAGHTITLALLDSHNQSSFIWLYWGAFIASIYVVYRHLRHDLFMLTGGCLSSIIIIVYAFISNISGDSLEDVFLLVPILIIGLTSLAAMWLKKVHKEMLS